MLLLELSIMSLNNLNKQAVSNTVILDSQIEERRKRLLNIFSKWGCEKKALRWLNKVRKNFRFRNIENDRNLLHEKEISTVEDFDESFDEWNSLLPMWLAHRIRKDFKWNREILSDDIETFLVKQLKKNFWKIKVSHIKNKFWSHSNEIIHYFEDLFNEFENFEIIYNDTSKTTVQQKVRKSIIQDVLSSVKEVNVKDERQILLLKLWKKLSEVDQIGDIHERVKVYTEIIGEFSKDLWYTINKEQFENSLLRWFLDVGSENILKKKLRIIINWWKWREWPTERHWYWRIKLEWSNGQRIVAYPNKEIVALLWHDDYIKFITAKPNYKKR